MKLLKSLSSKLRLVAILSVFATSSAFAGSPFGGAMVKIAATTSVPTLSGTMLLLLSLLLFVVAFRVAKQKSNSGKFFIMLIGASALLAAGNGVKLISEVQAIQADVEMTPTELDYRLLRGGQNLINVSGQPITVLSIDPLDVDSCTVTGGTEPCDMNNTPPTIPLSAPITFQPGEFCFIECLASGDSPVGAITEDINRGGIPTGADRGVESPAGNLVADAHLWATSANGAQIA